VLCGAMRKRAEWLGLILTAETDRDVPKGYKSKDFALGGGGAGDSPGRSSGGSLTSRRGNQGAGKGGKNGDGPTVIRHNKLGETCKG